MSLFYEQKRRNCSRRDIIQGHAEWRAHRIKSRIFNSEYEIFFHKMLTKYLIFVLIQISFSIGQNWEKKALIVEQTAAEFFKSSSEISDRNFIHKSSHLSLIITNHSTIGPVLYQTTISGIHDSLNLSNCWCCLLLWKNSDR